MKRLSLASILFAGSLAGGVALGGGADSRPARAAPPPDDSVLCQGAADSALGVAVFPDRVAMTSRGEALALRLELRSRFDRRAHVRYAIEIVDDLGNAVEPERIEPIQTLAPGASTTRSIRVPAGLADGFYAVRVTAVGKGGGAEAAEIVSAHFEVAGGAVLPLDVNDYLARSRANQEVSQ